MGILDKVLRFSIERRWLVVFVTLAVACLGVYKATRLPIDAVPDITNVQVQINTQALALDPIEVERRITFPIETAMAGIPNVEQVRSLSRYGLSQVTVVFEEGTDIYWARQQLAERLSAAKDDLPSNIGEPELGPISTGLGEIYLWTLHASPDAKKPDGTAYDTTDLRTLQDWVVKPQLRGVRGVTEVNSIGGYERTIQVAPDPAKLIGYGLSFRDLLVALEKNNDSAGGGYIEHKGEQYLVRASGLVKNADDIRIIVLARHDGIPVRVGDVAEVIEGRDLRTGAATENGDEVVIGTAIMLIGENSRVVSARVAERLAEAQKSLPEGVTLETVYDRTYLVDATLHTVAKNLLEGALLVVVVLVLLLGNARAAFIAALAIPASMLVAVIGMVQGQVSGNLMSLGAIDFGLIVDGAVIVVENSVRRLALEQEHLGRRLTIAERVRTSYEASREVLSASIFGTLIIATVYLPILTLTGVEGKMFRPMAITVILALAAAAVLSMTLVPALVALLLGGDVKERETFVMRGLKRGYRRLLELGEKRGAWVLGGALATICLGVGIASRLGTEFTPRLGEGAFALETSRMPSIALSESVRMQREVEKTIVAAFPDEVDRVFSRIGTAEVATDPMGPDSGDLYIMLKPRERWKRAHTQDELARELDRVLADLPGQSFEINQPIELRVNELVSGVKSDVAVKVFGDDMDVLLGRANAIARSLGHVRGAQDIRVEKVTGLPVLTIDIDRVAIARYGLAVADVQTVVQSAIGGAPAGQLFEGDRRFGIVLRLADATRSDPRALENLPLPLPDSGDGEGVVQAGSTARFVPLGAVAKVRIEEGPNQVSREDGKRRVVVQCNVRDRDLGGFVAEAKETIDREVKPAPGTWLGWGGQFENLIDAKRRLTVVVPIALGLIFALLLLSLSSAKNAALIFSGVPLAMTGGVAALYLRGLPVSISAAIGFIALSGVAVLNGLVVVTFIENLRKEGASLEAAVREGSVARLRPVFMTALVAALGFVPMALATGMGAEVQRPLATVVIGGIVSSTLLTLVVLPALYRLAHRRAAETRPDATQ